MKKVVVLVPMLALFALLMGCAMGAGPFMSYGGLYTGITAPVATGPADGYSKVGTASFVSVLGIVAVGDAGIEKAMQNGGITKIHHVDFKQTNILHLFDQIVIYVYGE